MPEKFDFGGYATKVDLRCSDGRTIRQNAFAEDDGCQVPLLWNHLRDDPTNVLGHAILENRNDGVYAYCRFNDNEKSKLAKQCVEHGDITSLSIYANNLVQKGGDVLHGKIREVSLVYAGANPGARIDNLSVEHADGSVDTLADEAIIHSGLNLDLNVEAELSHASENQNGSAENTGDGETAQDIFDTLNEKQKNLFYAMVGAALNEGADDEEDDEAEQSDLDEDDDDAVEHSEEGEDIKHSNEGGNIVKHNVFEGAATDGSKNTLTHADVSAIIDAAKRSGSLKLAVQDYALEHKLVDNATGSSFPEDVLFPDPKTVTPTPEMIMRNQDWVAKVWNATKKSPFSRIKSTAANITEDEARAKGYQKGKKKMEEVIKMLKRVTTPQTVYKLQKMDRDDIIDITDFDVVAWIKAEMRLMLNEELARAILIGDGRNSGAEDKINESNIRPIWTDDDLYTIKYKLDISEDATDDEKANQFIKAVHRARKNYMGSGSPVLYTDTDTVTTLLLAEDKIGRRLYNNMTDLANALRVREIVEVPVMEGQKRSGRPGVGEESGKEYTLMGLIVNLTDYTIGADRGGAVAMFDDFDIDYNKYTYLIETRCSGALTKPYSAIAIEVESAAG